jgi:hypothetical protein
VSPKARMSSRELLRQVRHVIERPYRMEMSTAQHDFGGALQISGAEIESQDADRIAEIGRLIGKRGRP